MHLGLPIVQAVLWAPQEGGARIRWYFGRAFTDSVEIEAAMQEEIGKLRVMNAPRFCNKSIAQKFINPFVYLFSVRRYVLHLDLE
jgi:hypothetical protein